MKSKNGKSTGIDDIPYEVLKFDCVIRVIHRLFMLCFESKLFPLIGGEQFKDVNSDPRISLYYRGISLLSTIYKIYSSVLNNRLVSYLEGNNVLVDYKKDFAETLLHGPRFHTQQYNSKQKRNFRYIH